MSLQLCTFYLNGAMYGIDVGRVQEVLRWQEVTPVPLGPEVLRGLLNLRGNIVSTLDLRRRLGLPDATAEIKPANVVVHTPAGIMSLLVDRIGDIVEVSTEQYEPAPEAIESRRRQMIRGVYKLDGGLLLALDIDKVLQFELAAA